MVKIEDFKLGSFWKYQGEVYKVTNTDGYRAFILTPYRENLNNLYFSFTSSGYLVVKVIKEFSSENEWTFSVPEKENPTPLANSLCFIVSEE